MKNLIKKNAYRVKYEATKAHADALADEVARLKAEITELRWENESLNLENKKLNILKSRLFEAGCIIARKEEDLKAENLKLKIRLDVLSKKGACEDGVQN